ncbi:HNH endonuclease [Arthrobacter sp. I2-34]|uniref:HNH endonuclease n=2 Tax=Arthrobacter hankyongi TaxID=2904801 RepID=A0ABS9L9U7_9MICC|nr:HNH endonuclease [Arthrobacter hankyongi]
MDQDVDGTELIDRIRALEDLKASAAAAQARATVAFDAAQRRIRAEAGVPAEKQGKGIAGQIALARRESPTRGDTCLGLAKALVSEMPHALRALESGELSEWRATLLVRETACLSVEDRGRVDEELAGDRELLADLGNRKLVGEARRLAYRLDPQSVVRRARKAESDRHVSCRPAPDTMTYVTGLLPVKHGVAVYAALSREADRLRAAGDERGRGQIMADILVERVTGPSAAGNARIEIQLVMTDRTLLQGDSEPAQLSGYGVVPAQWARDLVRTCTAGNDGPSAVSERIWLRRLYTAPDTGRLIAMDSRARLLPEGLRRLVQVRDATCRTPWCDAPIRHHDHVLAWDAGGTTSEANGQGLCEHCNQVKEAAGWRAGPVPGPRHSVEIVTPTGHRYRSTAPPLPGTEPPGRPPGREEPSRRVRGRCGPVDYFLPRLRTGRLRKKPA